jgi:hypothetical protein
MKSAAVLSWGLAAALLAASRSPGQQTRPEPCAPGCQAPPGAGPTTGLHWTYCCFPRQGCPDDYCPHPYPQSCRPAYPPFYECVPAGDCSPSRCREQARDGGTLWFLPTMRTLREALWCKP